VSVTEDFQLKQYVDTKLAKIASSKGQSRTASLAETATHIAIGFVAALLLTRWLIPGLGYSDNVRITAIFTAVSLVRGFVIRRIFNWLTINE
jgi:hypothetical protein